MRAFFQDMQAVIQNKLYVVIKFRVDHFNFFKSIKIQTLSWRYFASDTSDVPGKLSRL